MLNTEEAKQIALFANSIRCETLKCIASKGVGHVGGSLSIADVLAVLYKKEMRIDPKNPKMEDRDFLVVSKGHSGPAVYGTLALMGFFPKEKLSTLNKLGTDLPSHCDMRKTPGIDMTTGSLGQGASAACGIAYGNKLKGLDNYTYAIFGDGEIEEGQVWEAAMFAGHRKLDHLIFFVDNNGLQIDGTVDDMCSLDDIAAKFEPFGLYAQTVNGHDVSEIYDAIEKAKAAKMPSVIVLKTVKGYGVSRFAGNISCHSTAVTPEILDEALKELAEARKDLEA